MSYPGYEDPSNNQPEQPPAPTDPVSPPTIYTQAAPPAESPAPSQYIPTSPAAPASPSYDLPAAPASPSYEPPPAPASPSEPLTPTYSAGGAAVPAGPVAGPPGYGQTAPYPPVPAAPTYDPAAVGQPYSTQPYSTQPYSAQPYSAPPISGPYGYGMPMASAIPAPPEKRGRAGTVVLSLLTTLFLVAAGVLGTLFILKNQEANKLSSQVTELTGETTTQKGRIDTLQKDLDNTKRDLTDAQGETAEVTEQKKIVADCINAIYDYFEAVAKANGQTTKAVQTADSAVNKKCDEADKYLATAR